METKDLPVFKCTEKDRIRLFNEAVQRHPSSCPADAWVVVDGKGVCNEGFVVPYAIFDEEFLAKSPQFRLCWAADYFERMKVKQEETDFSHRFSQFEEKAVEKEKLLKEGEERIFVTSRYMETRELRSFIDDFSIYETNASGK